MPFLKCKVCNHIDVPACFTSRAGTSGLPPLCPMCFNDQCNIVEIGDEVSCAECIYHAGEAGSCTHPDNQAGNEFWNRPQLTCYTSRCAHRSAAHRRPNHRHSTPLPSFVGDSRFSP